MANEEGVKQYLDMQHRQYQGRASVAIVKKDGIDMEAVVGSYQLQEKFPYDANILKYFTGNPAESSILEYGCGPGRNLKRLAPKFKLVAGTDISEYNISNAVKFLNLNGITNFDLMRTTGDNVPFGSNMFDVVFEVICMQHICSYTIRSRIMDDLVRVTKPGGIMVMQLGFNKPPLPVFNNGNYYVGYYDERFDVQDTNGWCDCCVTDESQIINDFEKRGLKDIKTWHTTGVNDPNHDSWIWCCGTK